MTSYLACSVGFAEDVGADIDDGFADLSGGDLLRSLEGGDLARFGEQAGGTDATGGALVEDALFAAVILVTGLFPAGKHVFADVFALFTEGIDDFGIGNAVVHQGVDAPADLFGEAGDGAGEAFMGNERGGLRRIVGRFRHGVVSLKKR